MEGVGSLSLPLSLDQVRQLLASGDPAPYGRGSETVIDPDVRRATQLSAARVKGESSLSHSLETRPTPTRLPHSLMQRAPAGQLPCAA